MTEMCSVCIVRAQRDDDDFLPCSPACFRAALRACEERIKTHEGCADAERIEGYSDGYADGLDAAREAVAAVPHGISWGTGLHIHRERALAAIDVLREEQK